MNGTISYDDELVRWVIDLDHAPGPTTTLSSGDVTLYAAADGLVSIVIDAPLESFDPDTAIVDALQGLVGPIDLRRFRARRLPLDVLETTSAARAAVARAVNAYVDAPATFGEFLEACPDDVRLLLPAGTRERTIKPAPTPAVVAAWSSSPGSITIRADLARTDGTVTGTTWLTPRDEVAGVLDVSAPVQIAWRPDDGEIAVRVHLADGAGPGDVEELWLRIARADDGLTIAAAPLQPNGDVADASTALADRDLSGLMLDVTTTPFQPAGTERDRLREQAVALMHLAVDLGDGDAAVPVWTAAEALFERIGDRVRAAACRSNIDVIVVDRTAPASTDDVVDHLTAPAPASRPDRALGARRGRWLGAAASIALVASVAGVLTLGRGEQNPATPTLSTGSTTISSTVTVPTPSASSTTTPATTAPATTIPAPTIPPTTIPETTTPGPAPVEISGEYRAVDSTTLNVRLTDTTFVAGEAARLRVKLHAVRGFPMPGDGSLEEELAACPAGPNPALRSGVDIVETIGVSFWLVPVDDVPVDGFAVDTFDAIPLLAVAVDGKVQGTDTGLESCDHASPSVAPDGGLAGLFGVDFGPYDATIQVPAGVAPGNYWLLPRYDASTTSTQWLSGDPIAITVA